MSDHFTLLMGCVVMAGFVLKYVAEALDAAINRRWRKAAWNGFAIYGAVLITLAIWRAS